MLSLKLSLLSLLTLIIIIIIIIITIVFIAPLQDCLLRSASSPASVKHNGLEGREEGDGAINWYLAESDRKEHLNVKYKSLSMVMCYFSYSGFCMTMNMPFHASTFLQTAHYSSPDRSINRFIFTTCNLDSAFASLSALMTKGMQSVIICLAMLAQLIRWTR